MPCKFATYSTISGTRARSLLLLLLPTSRLVYIGSPNQLAQELHGSCRAAASGSCCAALLYSWPYGLPAATAQASYGTSARHVYCCKAESALTTAVIPEITGSHRLLLVEPAALAGTCLRCTRRSYTCLPQCYYRGIHAGARLSLLSC